MKCAPLFLGGFAGQLVSGLLWLAAARAVQPEATLEQSEEHRALHRVLGKLKALDRAAIVLRYWYDFSAETLNLSVPAVKSRLFHVRRVIATRLDWFEKHSNLAFGPPLA